MSSEPAARDQMAALSLGSAVQAKLMVARRARAEEEKARLKKMEEEAASIRWSTFSGELKEALVYLFFLGVFCAAVFTPRNADPFMLQTQVDNLFFSQTVPGTLNEKFYTIDDSREWFQWAREVFLPNFFIDDSLVAVNTTITGTNLTTIEYVPASRVVAGSTSEDFIGDNTNLRIGLARLHFDRVVEGTGCIIPEASGDTMLRCYASIEEGEVATSALAGTNYLTGGLPSYSSQQTATTYPEGGHTVDVGPLLSDATATVEALQEDNIVDQSVRSIFLDFTIYNPHTDIFAVVTASTEFLPSDTSVVSVRTRVSPLLLPHRVFHGEASSYDAAFLFLELILYGLVIFYIVAEVAEFRESDTAIEYLSSTWNQIDLLNYGIFVVTMGLRMSVIASMEQISVGLEQTDSYLEEMVATADMAALVDSFNAFNAVLCFVKVFKYTHSNKKLAQFTDTLAVAYRDMTILGVVIFVLCVGFGLAFQLAFGKTIPEYRNMMESLLSLFQSVLGEFNISQLKRDSPFIGTLICILWVFLVFFVLLSIFLATVDKAYEQVYDSLTASDAASDPIANDIARVQAVLHKHVELITEAFTGPGADSGDDNTGKAGQAAESERPKDPMLVALGEESHSQVLQELYRLEICQADMGAVLSKLWDRLGAGVE